MILTLTVVYLFWCKSSPVGRKLTLMREIPATLGLSFPLRGLSVALINWWGSTKTRISASLVALTTSGTATCKQGTDTLACSFVLIYWNTIFGNHSHAAFYRENLSLKIYIHKYIKHACIYIYKIQLHNGTRTQDFGVRSEDGITTPLTS